MWSAEIASICLCHKTVPSKGSWLSWHQQGQILLRCHFLFSSVLPDNAQALTSKGHIQCAYSKCIFKCLQIIANVSLYFHAFKCLFHPQQTERMGYYLCCHDDSGKLSVKYSVKNTVVWFFSLSLQYRLFVTDRPITCIHLKETQTENDCEIRLTGKG